MADQREWEGRVWATLRSVLDNTSPEMLTDGPLTDAEYKRVERALSMVAATLERRGPRRACVKGGA